MAQVGVEAAIAAAIAARAASAVRFRISSMTVSALSLASAVARIVGTQWLVRLRVWLGSRSCPFQASSNACG
ncbi:hypothetical protein ACF1A9_28730 [Streptomyces sp. NPDC014872]|uniref:hypothetical protein n=1 Tax=Streptomyces sp. NPDC014872 TaxID=3364926 RepID=UPI0036FB2AAC